MSDIEEIESRLFFQSKRGSYRRFASNGSPPQFYPITVILQNREYESLGEPYELVATLRPGIMSHEE